MSTSSAGGLILGLPTAATLGSIAARTSTMQGALNNANHIADERSRVLVSYPSRSTSTGGRVSFPDDDWGPIYSFGPFPILVDADGNPYPVRVRAGGRSIGGSACFLRIGVCPVGTAAEIMARTVVSGPLVESTSFTGTSNAWRVEGVVFVTGSRFTSPASLATVDAVSSASPVSVAAVMCTVEVWGKGAAENTACSQVYAAEQVAL